ncbi:VPS10 domain-containing protein [Flavihumibacter sp.]|uniref:VPS10 domain-containing protein n=1 Tax=Flavihumibacter sp. TaxID=1913981 RepID=UPI002FC8E46C
MLSSFIRTSKFASLVAVLIYTQSYAQIKPTTAAERLKGMQNRSKMEAGSILKDISFRNIGPTVMSGRAIDLEVNPDDPTEFYVAYASGGLWHTTNNGQSFIPIFDTEQVIGIGDIAVNWKAPRRSIWVGTGEENSSRSSYAGIGVFRSTNNGKTWEYLGLPESQHISKIIIHPADTNTAWVSVIGHLYSSNKERGVYKTTDGGKSWKQTLFIDEHTGVIDMDINPKNPLELYSSAWYRTRSAWNFEESGKSSGIYKSNDGGVNWELISKEGSGIITGDGLGRIGLAVSSSDPQIVYAVVDNQFGLPDTTAGKQDTVYQLKDFKGLNKKQFDELNDGKLEKFLRANRMPDKYTASSVKAMVRDDRVKPTALYDYFYVNDGFQNKSVKGCEVYRSNDAGKTWKLTHDKPINIFSTYGYYFGKIYVSPVNPDKLVILGIYAQLSEDGGKTFKTIDKPNVHADHHALWINPNRDNHMINGNDGGVNITYDNGLNWFKANSPAVAQYYSIALDSARPYNIYGGLQDNGSWYGPSNHKENIGWVDEGDYAFKRLNGGDGMQAQVDTRTNKIVYSGSQFGYYNRIDLSTKERKMVRPQHELGELPLRFNWQTPILLSEHNKDILYYGSNRFHRSLLKGDQLQTLSQDLTNGPRQGDVPFGTISTISESPLRFGLVYTGSDDGNIAVSKDGGNSWTQIGKPVESRKNKSTTKERLVNLETLPQDLYVSRVLASAYKENRVYVTLNGYRNDHFNAYVFRSDDYGASWQQLGLDLPLEPVNVIREDPRSEKILYIGTDGGVYASIDMGVSFMTLGQGIPRSVPVHDIAIHKGENEIVVATHGRSLYIGKLDKVQEAALKP